MDFNERYNFYRQTKNQKDSIHWATQDIIKWAQENGYATNKPTKKKVSK